MHFLNEKSGLEFSGGGTAGYMVKIVSVHVHYFSFFSLGQLGYVRFRQFMLEGRDVELDNMEVLAKYFRLKKGT